MGVLAFVVFPVLAPFRAVCGPFVWNPCGIPGAFCRGFPENLNPDQFVPFPVNPGVGAAGQVLVHSSHICQIGAADQGYSAYKEIGAAVLLLLVLVGFNGDFERSLLIGHGIIVDGCSIEFKVWNTGAIESGRRSHPVGLLVPL